MRITRTAGEVRMSLASCPRPLGLVPTMGALHAGHRALVDAARAECATVAASIFVNPLQFGPNEDFDQYPRAFDDDVAALREAGVDLVYAPTLATMYPTEFATAIDPGPVGARYEGALRPGHFSGVATVCVKLFATICPDRAWFGAKDAQQVAVLRRVVSDLNFPLRLVVVPTVRDADGLALSSRNAYLDDEQRAAAPSLHRALEVIAGAAQLGETDREHAIAMGRKQLLAPLREAYLDIVDQMTFVPPDVVYPGRTLAIGSAWCGTTRLIDNEPIERLVVISAAPQRGEPGSQDDTVSA